MRLATCSSLLSLDTKKLLLLIFNFLTYAPTSFGHWFSYWPFCFLVKHIYAVYCRARHRTGFAIHFSLLHAAIVYVWTFALSSKCQPLASVFAFIFFMPLFICMHISNSQLHFPRWQAFTFCALFSVHYILFSTYTSPFMHVTSSGATHLIALHILLLKHNDMLSWRLCEIQGIIFFKHEWFGRCSLFSFDP